jgi:hypothetical protein
MHYGVLMVMAAGSAILVVLMIMSVIARLSVKK